MTAPGGSAGGALSFRIGARTLAAIPRELVRIGLSLDEALAGHGPVLPALDARQDGWFVTSLPDAAAIAAPGIGYVRQRYRRYYVDLAAGEA
ncbi:GNAT family N-acetyltransferase, partial [Stenotrophomonas maltophilia]